MPSKCSDSPDAGNTGGGPKPIFEQSFDEILAGEELSNGLTSFVNDLAGLSKNPKIKRLSNDMNAVQSKYDNIESNVQLIANTFGGSIDQETQSMMNAYQNIEMAVAIGKAIFGKEPSLEESLSESQQAVRSHMLDISKNLRTMYDEVVAVEPYLNQRENYLTILDNKLQQIEDYNAVTSRERYFYLWYLDFDGYPNLQDYNTEYNNIQSQTVNQLLGKIDQLQRRFNMDNKPHIGNKELAFVDATNKINFYKMRYYQEVGQNDLAEQIKTTLKFDDILIGETIKLIVENFNQQKFHTVCEYSYLVEDYFKNEKVKHLYYKDIPGIPKTWMSDNEISRGEISIVIMLGIISAVETEQFTQAQNGLAVLTEFHNNTLRWSEEKSRGGRDKGAEQSAVKYVLAEQLTKSRTALNTARSYLNIGLKKYSIALNNIEAAMENISPTNPLQIIPEEFFLRLKILAYLGMEDYANAKEILREWKFLSDVSKYEREYGYDKNELISIDFMLDEVNEQEFYNVYIRYHKKDYKGAFIALKLLKKKIKNPEPKFYMLEEEIHLALGNIEEARAAHNNYINLLNE